MQTLIAALRAVGVTDKQILDALALVAEERAALHRARQARYTKQLKNNKYADKNDISSVSSVSNRASVDAKSLQNHDKADKTDVSSVTLKKESTKERSRCTEVVGSVETFKLTPYPENLVISEPRAHAHARSKSHANGKPARTSGSRLPADFRPPDDLWLKAKEELHFTDGDLRFETSSFRDYWLSSSGRNAAKMDWNRAWMNWMREAVRRGYNHHGNGSTGPPPGVLTESMKRSIAKGLEMAEAEKRGRK